MGNTTRAARVRAGKCAACLRRRSTRGHATCRPCRDAMRARSADSYDERRRAGLCTCCGAPADGYLCEPHAAARRARRAKR